MFYVAGCGRSVKLPSGNSGCNHDAAVCYVQNDKNAITVATNNNVTFLTEGKSIKMSLGMGNQCPFGGKSVNIMGDQ